MTKYEYSILPEYSPLYPTLPYYYEDYEKLSVFCRSDIEMLTKFIPKEFEVASDVFEVFVLKNNIIDGLDVYDEGGVVIPVKYKDIEGACVVFEYVTTDDSLCAGREIWGYPKKLAEVTFAENETEFSGTITRKGKKIIDIRILKEDASFPIPSMSPRLQVKRLPHPENSGTDINKIIKNELENNNIKKKFYGNATLQMEESEYDPLSKLNVKEIIGGLYVQGEFTLTFGEVLEDLQK